MSGVRSVAHHSRFVRLLLALSGGLLIALAFPTTAFWPLAFVALAPLILAAHAAGSRTEAFLLGESALTVTWLVNVPWVVHVMADYGGLGRTTGILIFIAMALVLGLYGGLFALCVRMLAPGARFRTWLLVPLVWCATEYARTYWLGGFPWNLLGETLINVRPLAMWAAVTGPYALGALAALSSTVLAFVLTSADARAKRRAGALLVIVVAAALGGGALLLARRERSLPGAAQQKVALLQPNITQEMRWSNSQLIEIFQRMMSMTDRAAEARPDVIIWPESTVPLAFTATDFYRDAVEASSRNNHVDIILGSVAEDPGDDRKIWNTAYLVSDGVMRGRYDKIRLVPFGEYVPLRKMLFFAEKLVHAVGEFQFGTNDRPLAGRSKYGPAICYEVVFPQITRAQVRHGADVLVTITNDAWFGDSAAPRQHLAMARMRAIETDRYLLRSATTGISALVDPTGRVVDELPLNREGIIVGGFSQRHSLTPYVRFGDWFAIAAALVTIISLLVRRKAFSHG